MSGREALKSALARSKGKPDHRATRLEVSEIRAISAAWTADVARLQQAIEALEPFAMWVDASDKQIFKDGYALSDDEKIVQPSFRLGHFRKALAAFEAATEPQLKQAETKHCQTFQEMQNEYDEDNWGCE